MSSTMPRQNLILLRIEWKGDDNEDGVGDDDEDDDHDGDGGDGDGGNFKSKWLKW